MTLNATVARVTDRLRHPFGSEGQELERSSLRAPRTSFNGRVSPHRRPLARARGEAMAIRLQRWAVHTKPNDRRARAHTPAHRQAAPRVYRHCREGTLHCAARHPDRSR